MRLIPMPLAPFALVPLLGACDSGHFQGAIAPCRCETEGCSEASCPITLLLDNTCQGEMPFAEVLVGEHVEDVRVPPLEQRQLCSRIEPGQEAELWVRGGPWVWGPLRERCEIAGETRAIVLQCVEAQ